MKGQIYLSSRECVPEGYTPTCRYSSHGGIPGTESACLFPIFDGNILLYGHQRCWTGPPIPFHQVYPVPAVRTSRPAGRVAPSRDGCGRMRYCAQPEKLLEYRDVNRAIEAVFREHGEGGVQMPPKVYITFPTGDFRTMPAFLPAMDIAGVKIVNVHPGNREHGLPTVMALTILIDPESGVPRAVLNATSLTDMRTGAAGAVAAKFLSPKREVTVGVIGSGRQAEAQVRALAEELRITRIRFWSREEKNAEVLASRFREFDASASGLERACDADVVITTTPSREPLVQDGWIHAGTHINAIGADAPGKEELDPRILLRARVFVDDMAQAVHSGEVNVPIARGLFSPDQIAGTLGEVVTGRKRRERKEEITVFDSTGLAIQDLAIARLALEGAEWIELPFP